MAGPSFGQRAGAIRIPDTVGHLVITADLRTGKATSHVDLDAPREGRPTTRVNWLVRQLKNAPDPTRLDCFNSHSRGSSAAELLSAIPENAASLVTDPTREIRTFRVAAACGLGTKRGWGRGCFIDPAMAAAAHEAEPTKPTSLGSTDYSSRTAPLTPRLLTLPPPSRRTTGAAEPVVSDETHEGASNREGTERSPRRFRSADLLVAVPFLLMSRELAAGRLLRRLGARAQTVPPRSPVRPPVHTWRHREPACPDPLDLRIRQPRAVLRPAHPLRVHEQPRLGTGPPGGPGPGHPAAGRPGHRGRRDGPAVPAEVASAAHPRCVRRLGRGRRPGGRGSRLNRRCATVPHRRRPTGADRLEGRRARRPNAAAARPKPASPPPGARPRAPPPG